LLLFSNATPLMLVYILITVLVGMTVHEFAHNYVAHLMGDPVPAREGRLTLDPRVHINWMGFAMFVRLRHFRLGADCRAPDA
jgi:Zn-dependent protease